MEILAIILAYLLGSIPFGLLITKYSGFGDIRNIGSGNIGATNVMRTGKKHLGFLTLLLDVSKGLIAVSIAKYLIPDSPVLAVAAIAAVVGHVFPVWLKFKGGKGVATSIAVFAVMFWPLALFMCVTWLLLFVVTKMSSASSIGSMILTIGLSYSITDMRIFITCLVIGLLVIYRHKDNITRILRGEENSFKSQKG